MAEQDFYNTIAVNGTAEFKDKGSRFIALACPVQSVQDFKAVLADVKKAHLKASHHCFAYRLGITGNEYRVSDDGEPSGSAGRPILGQIDSKEVTDILVVVVRYFGGTLLGVPGLINAYKSVTSLVLQVTPLVRKPVLVHYKLQYDYTMVNDVMTIIKQFNCVVIKNEMQLFCVADIGIPKNRLQDALHHFEGLHNLAMEKV